MKRLIITTSILLLSACASITTTQKSNDVFVIKFDAFDSDYWSNNSALPPAFSYKMQQKAQESCPKGYEKLKEYQVVAPPNGSHYNWEIRCLE